MVSAPITEPGINNAENCNSKSKYPQEIAALNKIVNTKRCYYED